MTEDFNIFSTMIHVSRRGRKTLKYHVSFSYRTCGLVIIDYNFTTNKLPDAACTASEVKHFTYHVTFDHHKYKQEYQSSWHWYLTWVFFFFFLGMAIVMSSTTFYMESWTHDRTCCHDSIVTYCIKHQTWPILFRMYRGNAEYSLYLFDWWYVIFSSQVSCWEQEIQFLSNETFKADDMLRHILPIFQYWRSGDWFFGLMDNGIGVSKFIVDPTNIFQQVQNNENILELF